MSRRPSHTQHKTILPRLGLVLPVGSAPKATRRVVQKGKIGVFTNLPRIADKICDGLATLLKIPREKLVLYNPDESNDVYSLVFMITSIVTGRFSNHSESVLMEGGVFDKNKKMLAQDGQLVWIVTRMYLDPATEFYGPPKRISEKLDITPTPMILDLCFKERRKVEDPVVYYDGNESSTNKTSLERLTPFVESFRN